MINSRTVVSNTPWWFPIIPSAHGFSIEGKMLDKIMCIIGNMMCPDIYYNLFFALLIDRYYDGLLLVLRQFLLIPNRNNKFTNLTANCLTPCFKSVLLVFDQYLVICDFFAFQYAISKWKALGSDISGSVVCISVCLTSLVIIKLIKILWNINACI